MVQVSDARHFSAISDSVYRFMPFDLTREELATLHAADERISVAALHLGSGLLPLPDPARLSRVSAG